MLQWPSAASCGNNAAGDHVHLEEMRVGPQGTSLNLAASLIQHTPTHWMLQLAGSRSDELLEKPIVVQLVNKLPEDSLPPLRFSRQRRFTLFSGIWHSVVCMMITNVSEEHAFSIFRAEVKLRDYTVS
jgi:hypothetical protein